MFKKKAVVAETLLKAAGFKVKINEERPRKGSFVVTLNDGGKSSVIMNLLDMSRPFKKLRETDLEAAVEAGLEAFQK